MGRLCAFNRVQAPLKVKAHKVNMLGLKRPTNTRKCGKGVYFVCALSSFSVMLCVCLYKCISCVDRTFLWVFFIRLTFFVHAAIVTHFKNIFMEHYPCF